MTVVQRFCLFPIGIIIDVKTMELFSVVSEPPCELLRIIGY